MVGAWKEAHAQREELMGLIIKWSGVGTMEDYRRFRDYDADKTVDRYLNKPAVKASLAPFCINTKHVTYSPVYRIGQTSCQVCFLRPGGLDGLKKMGFPWYFRRMA